MSEEKKCKAEFHQVYCDFCGFQPVLVEPPRWDVNHDKIYGDILCSKCHLVISTIMYNLKDIPHTT